FIALFAWIAFAFVSALAGFVSLLRRGGLGLGIARGGALPQLESPTALLLPTYNEDPVPGMAAIEAIDHEVAPTGARDHFHVFLLSDTTDPEIWLEEEAAFLALRERTQGHDRIFYRRRRQNIERKAGNIADWVRRFGAAYPQMLILDADSLMTGEA